MPQWTQAQREAIDARNSELLVSAAAGSGKTAVLVEHVLQLLREGGQLNRLLIITFTRAAAAELRERLIAALDAEAAGNAHLRRQMLLARRAQISTLHVFCHRVIRQHFQAADVDPMAKVGENTALEPLLQRALDESVEELCQSDSPDAQALTSQYQDAQIVEMARQLYTFLRAQADPEAWLSQHMADPAGAGLAPFLLILRKEALLCLEGAEQLNDQCLRLLELPGAPVHLLPTAQADQALLAALRDALRQDTLPAGELRFAVKARAPKNADFDPALADRFTSLRDRMKELAKQARAMVPADIDQARAEVAATLPALRALIGLVKAMDARYAQYKQEKNLLDYGDLEHLALKALDDAQVRQSVADGYDAIFVDEYQDVSAIEEAIVRRVHNENNRLFMVGDVKQSIYRFRLADPTLFLSKYEQFGSEKKAVSRRILLSRNFRSRGNILAAVNCVFARAMRRGATEIAYDDDAALHAGLESTGDPAVQLHIINDDTQEPAPDAQEEGDDGGEARKGWMYEAQLAARLIREQVGRPIRDKNGERALRYRDCVILLRSASGRAPLIAKILASEGVPAYSDADAQYFDLPEVRDVMNVLRVLDNPYQDVPLLSALRCPCFGFTSARLAEIRLRDDTRQKPFYQVFFALREQEEDVRAACERLDTWRFWAQHLPTDRLLWRILSQSGLYALAGAQRDGAARQANLRLLCERAQADGARASVHDFLSVSDLANRTGDAGAARELGENDDVVRIMTLHKSKGLEFPLVILMELARNFRMPSDGELLRTDAQAGLALKRVDAERRVTGHTVAGRALACKQARQIKAEEARLLYVGMTRARERLILLSSPRSMQGVAEMRDMPEGDYAAGCARCMLDWVVQAVGEGLRTGRDTLFTAANGSLWDLRYHGSAEFSQRLPQEEKFSIPDLSEPPSADFCAQMARPPRQSQLQKTSVTALLRGAVWTEDTEETPESKRKALHLDTLPPELPPFLAGTQLSAADRGTAAHKALGALDLSLLRGAEALPAAVNAQLAALAQRGVLTAEELSAIDPGDILAFLRSDMGARMLASPRVQREWSFCLRDGDLLVQGVIDLCFLENGAWVLVDYKTDRCPAEDLPAMYGDQLRWYARALREITGLPVRFGGLYSLRRRTLVPVEV